MTYFSKFPKIPYDIKGDKNQKLVSDILRRVKLRAKVADVANLFDKYDVPEGDTPETIALKHFGSTDYHWVILMTNDITDRFYGWPLDFSQFEKFIFDKYTNPDDIHHYEKTQSSGPQSSSDNSHLIECNSDDSDGSSVSNREYEQRLNDDKRRIKLMNVGFLSTFIEEFDKLIEE
tara:strand:+ start:395 stop:922 length:528 start_codon:yes stop_codon:yes gene_type:complete